MPSSKPLNDCTRRAEFAGIWSEFNTLAHVVGMPFYRVRHSVAGIARLGAPGGRKKLERIAREHLGTAAVAVLQGVVYQ
jgi:hypothetical protein